VIRNTLREDVRAHLEVTLYERAPEGRCVVRTEAERGYRGVEAGYFRLGRFVDFILVRRGRAG